MNEVLAYLGNYGKYQLYIFSILFLPFFMSGCLTVISTFTQGVPNTRCYIPGYDNDNTSYSSPFSDNVSDYLLLTSKKDASGNLFCSYCSPSVTLDNGLLCNESYSQTCSSYVYDTSQYQSSVTSLFNMVCDDDWKATLTQSLFMVGVFIGSGVFGVIGDRYGRRFSFLLASLSQIVVLNVVPVALNFYAYCFVQILVGGLQMASNIGAFVIVMELFDGFHKTLFGILAQSFFAYSYFYVGVLAYFIRDWQYLQLTVSLLSLLYIPYYWLLPESIRWLVLNNRSEEAKKLIEKAAKWNGVTIPEEVLDKAALKTEVASKSTVIDLFKDKTMAFVTLIIFFTWMVCSLTYYGLSWNTSWLPGNNYLDFILSGFVELISYYILCIPSMEYFGRRWSLVAFLGVGGFGCIISGLVLQKAVVITFNMLGKLCISAAFAIIYVYTTEVYPTAVRNAGTGFSSLVSRIGSIAAPQIALLAYQVAIWVPVIIYGSFGVAAAIFNLFLPETKGRQMGETLDDGLKFLKNRDNYINCGKATKVGTVSLTSHNC